MTLREVGLNPTRTAFLTVLRRMGASVDIQEEEDQTWEPCGTLTARTSSLSGTTVEPSEVPGLIDELPILMVAAACAHGTTRLCGVSELRVKETDRMHSMISGLTQMGVRIRATSSETVEIEGGNALHGAVVSSEGDHRTAMSLAVAALTARGASTLHGAECVAKSFPDFFEQLARLTDSPTGKTVDKP
jgi:3-phosphoshikimate 1-carboxyvinyltransferase